MCSRRSVCPCEQAQGVTALGFFVRGVACMPACLQCVAVQGCGVLELMRSVCGLLHC